MDHIILAMPLISPMLVGHQGMHVLGHLQKGAEELATCAAPSPTGKGLHVPD